jgi:hypothetical protein
MKERWKAIIGFEGLYEVSDRGRVKSLERPVGTWLGTRVKRARILKPITTVRGYVVVSLGKHQQKRVQQLVLEAFRCRRPRGLFACHRDGNKNNNTIGNLYWGSAAENSADMIRHGRSSQGSKNGNSKLNETQVAAVKQSGQSNIKLAKQFGVDRTLIWQIKRGFIWRHV